MVTYICKAIPCLVVIKHRSDISFENFLIFAKVFLFILLQLLRILLELLLAEDIVLSLLEPILNVNLVPDRRQRHTGHRGGCFLRELKD